MTLANRKRNKRKEGQLFRRSVASSFLFSSASRARRSSSSLLQLTHKSDAEFTCHFQVANTLISRHHTHTHTHRYRERESERERERQTHTFAYRPPFSAVVILPPLPFSSFAPLPFSCAPMTRPTVSSPSPCLPTRKNPVGSTVTACECLSTAALVAQ